MSAQTIFQLKEVELEPLLFGAKDAAKLLGIGERTLWELTREGAFPIVRLKNRTLWAADELHAWVNANKRFRPSVDVGE